MNAFSKWRFFMVFCLLVSLLLVPALAAGHTDGVYEGTGQGFGGDITLQVTIDQGKIAQVVVLSHNETPGVCDPAIANLPSEIVKADGVQVDTVAGATLSSKGILAAVQEALNASKGIVEEVPVSIIENPDVLVIGGGLAGMRSALEAAEQGAKVVILEKTENLGGTLGGGTLIGVNTIIQKETGIEDSPALLIEDFERLNQGYRDRTPGVEYEWNKALGEYFANHCGPNVDWLTERGVEFTNRQPSQPTLYEPMSVPRVSTANRSSISDIVIAELKKHIDEGNVGVLYNTTATKLIMDGSAVIGVQTQNKDFFAKATILCTGGYGYSEELVRKYNHLENFSTTSSWFSTGDGHHMAEQAGGALTNMDFLTVYAGGLKTPEGGLTRTMSIRVKDYPYIIFVNKYGQRFVDELGNEDGSNYDAITSWWKKDDNKIYILLDQAMVDDLKAQNKPIITGDTDWKRFDEQLGKGNILFSGATLEEVAQKSGIDGQGLAATVARYNGFAQAGKDEDFGRTRLMKAFVGGTYYLFETTPYIMITAGGPAMNDKGEVLNQEGSAIHGLYQAGEIVGMANAFGRTTIGGVGNTGSLVWGELAGKSAAEYALGK